MLGLLLEVPFVEVLPTIFQSVLGLVSDQSAGIGVGSLLDALGGLREPTGRLRLINFFGGIGLIFQL